MATDRTFYGGEGPSGGAGGEIGRVPYEGPGLGEFGPWKCPACGSENTGELSAGCVSCGSGSQTARKVETPTAGPSSTPLVARDVALVDQTHDPQLLASYWSDHHPGAAVVEAFVAGWHAALQIKLTTAPPITADVATLAPEGKPRRTIIAALEYFRDQILPQATDEVASGEWCSAEEIDQILTELKREEGLL